MKNFLYAFAAGCFLALATTNGAFAQSLDNTALLQPKQSGIRIDNSVFPAETNTVSVNTNTTNTKALKDFKKSYKNASGEKWVKNENCITASFSLNGVSSTIYYDKKGNWEASLKSYSEDKFDKTVRDMVKSKYYDYKITQVQEIETEDTQGTPTYIVHIEGDNDFKLIRVSDGEMDVYEEFERQK